MRDIVGSVIFGSGMVKNVGLAVGIASKYVSVQKLFLLPVLMAAILNFGCRPLSDHVVSAISESGVVENVGVAAETALKYVSVQKLFLLQVLVAAILNFGCRPLSNEVVSAISESGVVENEGVAVETVSPSPSVQKLSRPRFSTCQFSSVKPPFWSFRSVETRSNDVIL